MAQVITVDSFARNIVQGEHQFQSDTIKVALSNTAIASTVTELSDITEISAGSGYSAGGETSAVTLADPDTGVVTLSCADVTVEASGGSIGPFRYALIYNDTHADKRAIATVDIGAAVTLVSGMSFVLDFQGATITVGPEVA